MTKDVLRCPADVNGKANVSSLERDIEGEREGDIEKDILCPASRTIHDSIQEILTFLNLTLGSSYKASNKKTSSHITARLRDGFTIDDFKVDRALDSIRTDESAERLSEYRQNIIDRTPKLSGLKTFALTWYSSVEIERVVADLL